MTSEIEVTVERDGDRIHLIPIGGNIISAGHDIMLPRVTFAAVVGEPILEFIVKIIRNPRPLQGGTIDVRISSNQEN